MAQPDSFDIDRALELVREAAKDYPPPAPYQLAAAGYQSAFEQLVACIIAARERDDVTVRTAGALFHQATTPEQVSRMSIAEIDHLLRQVGFHHEKARWIHESARTILHQYGGEVPCDDKKLLALPGVGPKCANLVLAIACHQPAIVVETHVHRLVNAWGYVHTRTPGQTLRALENKLPQRYWSDLFRWLEPFDKYACQPENRQRLNPETRALCPAQKH